MRWVLVSLWLLGAALYAAGTFIPSNEERSEVKSALVWPDDAQRGKRPGLPSAPSPQKSAPSGLPQAHSATSQTLETQEPPLNDLAASSAVVPSDNPEQRSWGQLMRGAPVHGGPSVSSEMLGYASPGTEMQIVEWKQGWVRVIDPATSREGWIVDQNITIKEGPSGLATGPTVHQQEAALETDADLGEPEQPKRSFNAKKPRKHYAKKRWRKRLRFGFRFRRY
jgi:hypothetical protein